MDTGTEAYYARRAREYDLVYAKAERQTDIAALAELATNVLRGRHVLEVAAGTGFWTDRYADTAAGVVATDVNDTTLDVARSRRRWPDHVRFETCDAFALDRLDHRADAAFVGFFWSHVRLDDLDDFLAGLVRALPPASVVLVADNNYVEGSNHPISTTDAAGNTYQQRRLADGTDWLVLKNFPTEDAVASRLRRHGTDVTVTSMTYYWAATFTTHR